MSNRWLRVIEVLLVLAILALTYIAGRAAMHFWLQFALR